MKNDDGIRAGCGEFSSLESPSDARAGFTLVELLVVLAVIGLLAGILIPALRMARDRSRDVVCLGSHRQFASAWAAYSTDEGTFPWAEGASPYGQRTQWGGVDWYKDDADVPLGLHNERPINPYLGTQLQQKGGSRIFRCPRDNSMRYTLSDRRIDWEDEFGYQSTAEDVNESVYAILGTSYAANEWIWVHPQSEDGYGDSPYPYLKADMTPDDVLVSPSRFILVMDYGADLPGRYRQGVIYNSDFAYGWWHGKYIGMCTFLDGSARREELDGITTNRYTYYSNPDVQWRGGVRP